MKISTRGIYAVRFMTFLAQHSSSETPVSLKEVASKTNISRKYLEQIASSLTAAKLVKASRGAGGGYKLAKSPAHISMFMVLEATEGSLVPVEFADEFNMCKTPAGGACFEMFMWRELYETIKDYLSNVSLQDILERSEKLEACSYSI